MLGALHSLQSATRAKSPDAAPAAARRLGRTVNFHRDAPVGGHVSRPMRLEVVGLRVTNLRRSLRFYTKALGLKVVARGDTRGWGGGIWIRLQDPRTHRNVELNWYPRNSIFFRRYTLGEAVDHLDFSIGVAPRSTLESVHLRLVRAGARTTAYCPSTTQGWMASVRDPDGIWITIGRRPTTKERHAMAKPRKPGNRKRSS